MGCCVVACEIIGIELTGNDIDVMFDTEDVETESYVEVHESIEDKTGDNA
jgi:hypothetical protein